MAAYLSGPEKLRELVAVEPVYALELDRTQLARSDIAPDCEDADAETVSDFLGA